MKEAERNPILTMLIRHEEALAGLYRVFKDHVAEMGDFWARVAHEETGHAKTLDSLAGKLGKKPIYFNPDRFDVAAISRSKDDIIRNMGEVRERGITLLEALGTALDLERSMLEDRYYEVFETDSPEIGKAFDILRNDTKRHFEEIGSALQNISDKT